MDRVINSDFNDFKQVTDLELKEEIKKVGTVQFFKKGEEVVRQGQYLKVLPIVLKGSIRVFQTNEDREILLYYVLPQETCMMSLTACLFNNESASYAITEEDTDLLLIPAHYIAKWQKQYPSWNRYVMDAFKNRYEELLDSFNKVVFKKIDERVMDYLNEYCRIHHTNKVKLSHKALALELGTTRVVISRILKAFETKNKVKLHRGYIELLKC